MASMPSMRAPLAMMSAGYTPSSEPLETTIETLVMGSDGAAGCIAETANGRTEASFSMDTPDHSLEQRLTIAWGARRLRRPNAATALRYIHVAWGYPPRGRLFWPGLWERVDIGSWCLRRSALSIGEGWGRL